MIKEKISVIIPAFNEEEIIVITIKETIKVLKNLGIDYEIIIIDDGSNDNTHSNVNDALNDYGGKVRIERYEPNKGKGFAIKHGCSFATGKYIFFIDADMDLHPSQIKNFLDVMKNNKVDVVMGSKRHKDSVVEYPMLRKILSTGYYFLIKILFGLPVKDTQTGIKLFKSDALKKSITKIIVKKYAFDLELLVILHKYNYKILECPIYLEPTRKYYNRIGSRDIYNVFIDTIAIFYRLHILKYYD